MPWKARSGKEYSLCLLDTNAISEILKNPNNEGKGFIEKFPPLSFVPCFTIYNVIELRRITKLYEKFLDFFSIYPIFIVKPQSMILDQEIVNYGKNSKVSILLNAFSKKGDNPSYNIIIFFDKLFNNTQIKKIESSWRYEEHETLNNWLSMKENFSVSSSYPNLEDAEEYMNEAGLQTLINLKPDWCGSIIKNGSIPNIDNFPSLKISLYSLYYRLYNPSWIAKPGEVTDIQIISAVPYVDNFITEKFQANIITKIKNRVKYLDLLSVKRLKDIRS